MFRIGLVVGLILVGAIAGTALSFAPAYFAIPIGLILLVPVLLARRARKAPAEAEEPERNRLGARRQRFTERDRRTLYS